MPRCLPRRLAGTLFGMLASAIVMLIPAPAVHAANDDAFLLIANPGLVDADYRQTVLIAAPSPRGGHVGVILNRPTRRSLGSLFPEHEPSKKVLDPVFYGGPFARGAVVAIVKAQADPGSGSVPLMKDLYLAFRASVIDTIIEATPNEARYYVGYVGWQAGELKSEIERGVWSVLDADRATPFRRNTDGLWEEMLQQSRRLHVEAPASVPATLYALMPESAHD
jgi:putative transcriptional regulator